MVTSNSQPRTQRQLRVFAAVIGLLNGVTWGMIAVTIVLSQAESTPVTGWFTGTNPVPLLLLLPALMLLGALPGDFLSRRAGRKVALLTALAFIMLGSLFLLYGVHADYAGPSYLTGLIAVGLGLGAINVILPKILHELAARGHRRLLPGARAMLPAGVGLELALAAGIAYHLDYQQSAYSGGVLLLGLAQLALIIQLQLPESPHWYIRAGKIEQAHAALVRMHGELEGSAALDWVKLDAETRGEQQPIGQKDLSIPQVRETVLAGLALELVQALPLGLAGMILLPLTVSNCMAWASGVASASAGSSYCRPELGTPVLIGAAGCWIVTALVAQRRRGERRRYLWLVGGVSLATCATLTVLFLPRLSDAASVILLGVISVLLVAAQYVMVLPACTGGIDALVPPWLLRSQRRASAVFRPVAQAIAVLLPVLLLPFGLEVAVVVLFCLQMGSLLLGVLVLPRALRLLR